MAASCVAGNTTASKAQAQTLAVRGETVHTMAGPAIADGVVLIRDGKIAAVGRFGEVRVPQGTRVLSAKVVTPGLIDAHSVVGLTGLLNQDQDQDQLERSEPLQPELRAIDAYNGKDELVDWVRGFGVTTIHTGHAPGEVISGQTMIIKTTGRSVEADVIVPTAMVAATLGEGALKTRRSEQKTPGTRAKSVALLRTALVKARTYARRLREAEDDKKPDRDLRLEVLSRVLAGELPLMVTVNRAHDILTALRVAEEFGIRLVLDGAAESYLVLDRIKAAKVPVIVHPTMARSRRERENLSMETAATLRKAGIPIAIQSGYESYVPKTRVILFEAAVAAANGLSFEDALAAITLDAAKILGIDRRVGSLAVGKDADLALYDGDPFEYTSHCTGVIIDGRVVSSEPR